MNIDISNKENQNKNSGDIVTILLTPSLLDMKYIETKKEKLDKHSVDIDLVPGGRLQNVHNDLLGLVALLIAVPFTKDELTFNFPVSSGFAEIVKKYLKKNINYPNDYSISRRSMPSIARHTLAFSGGVDSCTALILLPPDTVPVFMLRRTRDSSQKSLYRSDAALHSCKMIRKLGYDVMVIKSSLEEVRKPIGFPIDWSNSAPIVINADIIGAKSVSFGMVMESAFYLGREKYSDLSGRQVYNLWAPVFEYVNLPIVLPTAGLSEVSTAYIALKYARQFAPESCIRGCPGVPCMNCFKCFRKTILNSAIKGEKVKYEHYQMAFASNEVKKKLLQYPMHHEIVMAWAINNSVPINHPIYNSLKIKMEPVYEYGDGLKFLTKL